MLEFTIIYCAKTQLCCFYFQKCHQIPILCRLEFKQTYNSEFVMIKVLIFIPFSYKHESLWIAYYQIGSGFSARLSGDRRQDI